MIPRPNDSQGAYRVYGPHFFMKKQLILIPIKNTELVKAWAKSVTDNRHQEAVESLAYEGVTREEWWLVTIAGEDYWAFTIDGEAGPSDPSLKINQDHKVIKRDTFGDGPKIMAQLLADLEA